jgi:predicted DCC family thiol-disulfide oxidoreductase YuxK
MTATDLPLLVFDGDCGFCTTSAQWAQRRLRLPNVEPWQFLELAELGLSAEACATAVQWVGSDGSIVSGERAVIAALRHAGGAWGAIGRLLALPGVRQLAGVAYRLVARYRYRLPGGTPACRLR